MTRLLREYTDEFELAHTLSALYDTDLLWKLGPPEQRPRAEGEHGLRLQEALESYILTMTLPITGIRYSSPLWMNFMVRGSGATLFGLLVFVRDWKSKRRSAELSNEREEIRNELLRHQVARYVATNHVPKELEPIIAEFADVSVLPSATVTVEPDPEDERQSA